MTESSHGEGRYQGQAGEEYFAWQSDIGRMGGRLDRWKFEDFVNTADVVADFGCGGGFLLETLSCARRIGIELNPVPRQHAATLGIETHSTLDEVTESSVDVLISNHALEHVQAPHAELVRALRILKPGGRAVFVVPYEGWWRPEAFAPNDINQHLYAWTPMLLGNLFQAAGYEVERSEVLWSAWTPSAWNWWGWSARLYRVACFFLAIKYKAPQLRIVARRPRPGT
jgi:SAM-dependent methyltransferase